MAITIDYGTNVINVPRADMTLVQSSPIEIRELDMNTFHLTLRDLEDDEAGMPEPTTHNYVAPFTISGIQLARIVEILDPYTVTFEDGQYAVNLVNANTNLQDKVNINQVSVRPSNSAGLVQTRELEYSSFQNGVWLDLLNGTSGTAYPIGTAQQPVSNLTDALFIANLRGFVRLYLVAEDNDFGAGDTVTGFEIVGVRGETHVHCDPGSSFTDCSFENVHLHGDLFGSTHLMDCNIGSISGANGEAHNCIFEAGTTTLQAAGNWNLIDCHSGIAGTGMHFIDCNGSGDLQVRGFNGGIHIQNKTSGNVSIDMISGNLMIDATCTGGTIVARGICAFTNMAVGADVRTQGLIEEDIDTLRILQESRSPTHQGYGSIFFVNPVGGLDSNDGRTDATAFKTIQKAVDTVVSGRNDIIALINPDQTGVTVTEDIVLNKDNVHIRGPGRDFTWRGVAANGTILTVDGYNCSLQGVFLDGNTFSDYCCVVNGKHFKAVKPWMKLALQDCLLIRGGDYHEFIDAEIEKAQAGAGVATFDAGLASGSPREITFIGTDAGCNIYLNTGDGVRLDSTPGAGLGNTTRIVRFLGHVNIHANGGFGISSQADTDAVMIGGMTHVHGNNGGHDQPQFNLLGEAHNEIEEKPHHIAEAVWDRQTTDIVAAGSIGEFVKTKLLTVGKFLGLK